MEEMGKMTRLYCSCFLLLLAQMLPAASLFETAHRSRQAHAGDSINHNAVSGRPHTEIPLKGDGLNVYYVTLSGKADDEALWSLADSAGNFQATTQRTALPTAGKYINYANLTQSRPTLGSFVTGNHGSKLLTIGNQSPDNLPVNKFEGTFAEYLVFDRNLSSLQRSEVETYLALKYGITLSQDIAPQSYVSSEGIIVWDGRRQAAYNHAIAGIGRDDASGLRQKRSGSSAEPGLLELSVSQLENGTFYVWGNDQGELRFRHKRGEGCRLGRKWMGKLTGTPTLRADWHLNTHHLDALPESGSTIYLAVDESGTGLFPASQTRFYAGQSDSLWHFKSVKLTASAEGYSHFVFVAASDFFVWIQQKQPSCHDAQGAIDLQIVGGRAPFKIKIADREISTSERTLSVQNLPQADYTLSVSDADGKVIQESFLLANQDFGLPHWDPVLLKKGYSVDIDATVGTEGYSYQWDTPNGESLYAPTVRLEDAGIYRLTVCDNNGCTAKSEVEVRLRDDEIIELFSVYPNPTRDGHVKVLLQLNHTASASLYLTDMNGRLWDMSGVEGQSLYEIPCYLPNQGRWLLTVCVAGETKSVVLIRQ